MIKMSSIAENYLINPIKDYINKFNQSTHYISTANRICSIDSIIAEYKHQLMCTEYEDDDTPTMEKINEFFKIVSKFLNTSYIKCGDFNNFNNIYSLIDFSILKNRCDKIVTENCSEMFVYSIIGICKDCGDIIELSYKQASKYSKREKEYAEKGKKYYWPIRCNTCERIRKIKYKLKKGGLTREHRKELNMEIKGLREYGMEEFLEMKFLDRF